MSVTQSTFATGSPTSTGVLVLVVLGSLCLLSYLAMRVLARVVAANDSVEDAQSGAVLLGAMRLVGWPVGILALGLPTGLAALLRSALERPVAIIPGDNAILVLSWLPVVGLVFCVDVAAFRGMYSLVSRDEPTDGGFFAAWREHSEVLLTLVLGAVAAAALTAFYLPLTSITHNRFLQLFVGYTWFVGVGVLASILYAAIKTTGISVQPLSGSRRHEIDRLRDDFDVPLRGVWLDEDATEPVAIVGSWRFRQLFVSDALFSDFTPSERRAVLLQEFATAANHQTMYRYLVWSIVGLMALVLNIPELSGRPLLLVALEVVLVGVFVLSARHGFNRVFSVDERVADETGPAVLARALERTAQRSHGSTDRGQVVSLLSARPSIARRIDRLLRRQSDSTED